MSRSNILNSCFKILDKIAKKLKRKLKKHVELLKINIKTKNLF